MASKEASQSIHLLGLVSGAVINGKRFHMTTKDRKIAEREAQALGGVVRDYGVDLKRINPSTLEAIDWEKTKGFSVWLD